MCVAFALSCVWRKKKKKCERYAHDAYRTIIKPVKAAPGSFRNNTNWDSRLEWTRHRERDRKTDKETDKQKQRQWVYACRVKVPLSTLYYTVPTHEMHFYDGIRTNGFSSHIIGGGGGGG